jgi:hypothetical protein
MGSAVLEGARMAFTLATSSFPFAPCINFTNRTFYILRSVLRHLRNPLLGQTSRRCRTCLRACCTVRPLCSMRYAMTIVGDLLMPARQCTNTLSKHTRICRDASLHAILRLCNFFSTVRQRVSINYTAVPKYHSLSDYQSLYC